MAAVVKSDDEYVGVLSEFNFFYFLLVWCDYYLFVCFWWVRDAAGWWMDIGEKKAV